MHTTCAKCHKLMKLDSKTCPNCFAQYDENNELIQDSPWVNLKWCLVILSPIIIIYFNYLIFSSFELKPFVFYLISFLIGVELIFAGFFIAPKSKVKTAFIMFLLFLIIGVLNMFITFRAMDFFTILGLITGILFIKFKYD